MLRETYQQSAEDSYERNAKSQVQEQDRGLMAAYSDLNSQIEKLGSLASELRSRLSPVLSPSLPSAGEASKESQRATISPMGESILSDVYRVKEIQDILNDIHNRLEVA